jgi:hypothetical protein
MTAAAEEWEVICLGGELPGEAIADAATRAGVRLVSIWLSPVDDLRTARPALRAVRAGIPAEVALTASGPGAVERQKELTADGVSVLPDRRSLAAFLESFR